MAINMWIGGAGNWTNAADWSSKGPPGGSDDVVIGAGSRVAIAPVPGAGSVSVAAASITLDGPSAVLRAVATAANEYIYVPGTIGGGIMLAGISNPSSDTVDSVQITTDAFGAGLFLDVVGTAYAGSAAEASGTSLTPLMLSAGASVDVGPGGDLSLGDIAGAGAIHVASGTLFVGASSVPIQMDNGAARLALSANHTATIKGFRAGDVLDFSPPPSATPDGIPSFPSGSYQAQVSGDQLQVTCNGTIVAGVTLAGSQAPGATYHASLSDPSDLMLSDILVTTTAQPAATAAFTDQTTGAVGSYALDAALGGPSYLRWQYIDSGSDTTAITASVPDLFLKGGSGTKALAATSGQNVLDGGTGSAFLVGGSGTDTFFVDLRGSNAIWDTLVNFHAGDAVTIWGWLPGVSTKTADAQAGAVGYQGATLQLANGAGGSESRMTFAGLSADRVAHLQASTGTANGLPYLYLYNPGV